MIANALKFTEEGSVEFGYTLSNNSLEFYIQDTGIGIKQEDFGKIFEPYHTNKPGGTGLGLMIVQRIIQEHGGEMAVVSTSGEGTTFTITLPTIDRRTRLLNTGDQT